MAIIVKNCYLQRNYEEYIMVEIVVHNINLGRFVKKLLFIIFSSMNFINNIKKLVKYNFKFSVIFLFNANKDKSGKCFNN